MRKRYKLLFLVGCLFILFALAFISRGFRLVEGYFYAVVVLLCGLWYGFVPALVTTLVVSFFSFSLFVFDIGIGTHKIAMLIYPIQVMCYFLMALIGSYYHKRIFENLPELGYLDDLRSTFYALDVLEQEMEKVNVHGGQLTIAILDLDNFKAINNKLGYTQGDLLLRLFGRLLMRNIRPSDIATRYTGDEFLVIFPNTNGAVASEVLDNLRNAMDEHKQLFIVEGVENPFSFCAGIAEYCRDYHTVRDFFRAADEALFSAKERGPDSSVIIDVNKSQAVRNRRYWERLPLSDEDNFYLVLYDKQGLAHKVKVGNVCMAGVMFYAPVNLAEGDLCELEFIFSEKEKVIVDAKTIWSKKLSDKTYQVGVFISQLSPKQRFLFHRNLKKMKGQFQKES